jgi:hypothetical protein
MPATTLRPPSSEQVAVYEKIDTREILEETSIASVAAGKREGLEQSRQAPVPGGTKSGSRFFDLIALVRH